MDALRRTLLKGAGATGAIAAAIAAGVLKPSQVLAAESTAPPSRSRMWPAPSRASAPPAPPRARTS
jgi:hypothetical protein